MHGAAVPAGWMLAPHSSAPHSSSPHTGWTPTQPFPQVTQFPQKANPGKHLQQMSPLLGGSHTWERLRLPGCLTTRLFCRRPFDDLGCLGHPVQWHLRPADSARSKLRDGHRRPRPLSHLPPLCLSQRAGIGLVQGGVAVDVTFKDFRRDRSYVHVAGA